MAAYAPQAAGSSLQPPGPRTPNESGEEIRREWQRRVDLSKQAQRSFHGTWAVNLAFAAGQHWLVWDENHRQLRSVAELNPEYQDRELYTADRITELIQAQLGELTSDDERPELLVAQHGDDAEKIADAVNRMAEYAWEHEWQADAAIERMRLLLLPMGVCAVRCIWDPAQGERVGYLAKDGQGQPVTDPQMLQALEQQGTLPDGSLPQVEPKHAGRTVWQPFSAFQCLTPPGVTHEDDFRWEALREAVHVDEIFDTYGVKVREDADIANGIGLPSGLMSRAGTEERTRLRDHAWVYHCYDRPGIRYPEGRECTYAGPTFDTLAEPIPLRYQREDQPPHTGVVYFHWWRLADRFASRGFVESLRDPQRIINRRKTQNVEIIDRNMPRTYVRKGDLPNITGLPGEVVQMGRAAQPPQFFPGAGPGQWMYQDIAALDEDLSHASTLAQLRLGENPASVQNFSQLALLNDNEHGKRQTIQVNQRNGIALLTELSMGDIKRYWPEEKQAQLIGDDDKIETATFQKDTIPVGMRVRVAKGQPLPKSQGAEIKKIDAVWQAAVEGGAVVADPPAWVSWYKQSLEAGSAQDLPVSAPSTQQQMAHLENALMRHGEVPAPAYYDNLQIHLPIHREEQDQARAAGDAELGQRLEQHLQQHLMMAQMNVEQGGGGIVAPPGAAPGGPPGIGPGGPPTGAALGGPPMGEGPAAGPSRLQSNAGAPVQPINAGGPSPAPS